MSIIIAPPSPPQNLKVVDVTNKSVSIEWQAPATDGGSPLIGYMIEKRLATLTSTIKWTHVISVDSYCIRYCVDNLKEKSEYVFRVLAENEAGLSAPAVTDNVLLKTNASK